MKEISLIVIMVIATGALGFYIGSRNRDMRIRIEACGEIKNMSEGKTLMFKMDGARNDTALRLKPGDSCRFETQPVEMEVFEP